MSGAFRNRYLFNPIFIIGLLILFLNDHLLKWTYSNWLTGKISDFAGILILPFFLSFLFPKQIRLNVIGTGLFFLFWKSPFSQYLIDSYNTFAPIAIWRVIDYTDYIALAILPVSYAQLRKIHLKTDTAFFAGTIPPLLILVPAIFVFMATSPPPANYYMVSDGKLELSPYSFSMPMDTETLLAEMRIAGIEVVHDDAIFHERSPTRAYFERDSMNKEPNPFYRVEELIVEGDTLRNIQFSLMPVSKEKTKVFINGLGINSRIAEKGMNARYIKYYRRLLKKRLFRRLK